ncbi:hypothetical protein ACWCQL_36125 [Streptomyces sp. NPDC002073]
MAATRLGQGLHGTPGPRVDLHDTIPSLLWPQFVHHPHPLYATLRERFPLVYDDAIDAYLLSRYDDVRAALSDERFTQRSYAWSMEPMFGRTLVQMEGQEHTVHRALLAPAFLGRAVAAMRTGIEETVGRLIDGLRGRATADLAAEFCVQFPIHGIVGILGLPQEDAPLFRHWYQECVATTARTRRCSSAASSPVTSCTPTWTRTSPTTVLTPAPVFCRTCAPPRSTASGSPTT